MLRLTVREWYRIMHIAYRQTLICYERITHIYNKNRASFSLVTEPEVITSLMTMSAVGHNPKPVPFTSLSHNLTHFPDIYINDILLF